MTARRPIAEIAQVRGLQTALGARGRSGRIVCLGDSITKGTYIAYPQWLHYLRGGQVINAGISGDHLHDMRDRLTTAVLAESPGMCIILGGTNDIANGETPENLAAYVEEISDMLLAAGVEPVWVSVLPRASAYRVAVIAFNGWLASYCALAGLRFIDAHSALADGNGDLSPTYAADAGLLHLNELGSKVLGVTVHAGLPTPAAGAPWRWTGETLLIPNGTFTDTNEDGLADGFTKTQSSGVTCTTTVEAHSSEGNWQKVASSGGSGLNSYAGVQYLVTGLSDLQHAEAEVDVVTSSLEAAFIRASLRWQDAAYAVLQTDAFPEYCYPQVETAIRLRSGRISVPEGTARLVLNLSVFGSGDIWAKFGRLAVRALNP